MSRTIPPLTDAERAVFLDACMSLSGARFAHRGRSMSATDCIGVGVFGMRAVGREVNDPDRYPHRPDGHTLRAELVAHLGEPIHKSKLQPADIVLMHWHEPKGRKLVNHVGVVMPPIGSESGLYLLHAYHSSGEVIHHRIDAKWFRRIVEGFRP